jgi:hypothetical protein
LKTSSFDCLAPGYQAGLEDPAKRTLVGNYEQLVGMNLRLLLRFKKKFAAGKKSGCWTLVVGPGRLRLVWPWIRKHGLGHLKIPRHCTCSFHMFWLLLPNLATRTRLIRWLQAAGIKAVFHYVPLNQSTFVRKRFGSWQVPSQNSVRAGETLVRLPFYPAIQPKELKRILLALLRFPVVRTSLI